MTQSSISNNLVPSDPDLKDVLDLFKKDILLGLNCHHIGTVQAFNAENQTIQATINYTKTYFEPDALGNYVPKQVSYPVIIDAPLITMGGGNSYITFPVAPGDECLVLFNDRDIDVWFNGSSSSPVATGRLHSFSDALILIGPNSMANVVDDYNTEQAEFRNEDGSSKVTVSDTQVGFTFGGNTLIVNENGLTVTLGTSGASLGLSTEGKLTINNLTSEFVNTLVNLFTSIQGATAGGSPLVMPTFPAALANLETFKS